MKKLIYGVLSLAIVGIGVVGCKKEDVGPDAENFLNGSEVMNTKALSKLYYDNGGDDYGCKPELGNCKDEVIIKPSSAQLISDLFDLVEANNQNSAAELISLNLLLFNDIFSHEFIDGFLKGDYTLSVKRANSNGVRFVLFVNSMTGSIDHVAQLK